MIIKTLRAQLMFVFAHDTVLLVFLQIHHVKSRHALIDTRIVPNGATMATVTFIPITCTRNARSVVKPVIQVQTHVIRLCYSS